jgi:predicted nucleic acid-binding protein
MGLVIDASMVLSWHFRDEADPHPAFMRRAAAESVVVPGHFGAEIANGVLIGERRGRSVPGQTANLMDLLELIDPEVDDTGLHQPLLLILPIARAHRLTVYDAIYLELAQRRGLPLATLDTQLAAAARAVAVPVLGRGD